MTYQASDHFRLLAAAALIDGKLHDKEVTLLTQIAQRLSLPEDSVEMVLRDLDEHGHVSVECPEDRQDQEALFEDLLTLVTADQDLSHRELQLLQQVGDALGFSEAEVKAQLHKKLG